MAALSRECALLLAGQARTCVLLWRMFLEFEHVSVSREDDRERQTRNVFFRAMQVNRRMIFFFFFFFTFQLLVPP
eukprot:m.275691 g.275691  ORF g.275691 m.275691 type:complete len:75 (-) comp22863_c1_seq23:127-351(-)